MVKKLLTLSMLAATAIGSANAGEYYLIKDGKLHEGVEIMEYEIPEENTFFSETTAPDGTPAFSLKGQTRYKDTRFYFPEGIDLSKYWNVEIEFYFKDGDLDVIGHRGSDNGLKWPAINMGYIADTVTVGKKTNDRLDDSYCQNSFDVKIKNKPDVWNVERQMIYAPVSQTEFKCFVLGWQRQILRQDSIGPVYIKNLKFYGEGSRPFFAEDFNTQAAYAQTFDNVQTYVVNSPQYDDPVALDEDYSENFDIFANQHSGLPIYSGFIDGARKAQSKVSYRRLYEDEGTDGSGYFDPEILHAISIEKAEARTGRNGRTFFLIPTAGLEQAEAFTLDYICKWDGSKAAKEFFTDDTPADSLEMKVFYAFVDDAVEANTCEMKPGFNQGDLLSQIWTPYHVTIPNEIGSKKYIALIFDRPNFFSYCVDNIRIAATNNLNLGSAVVEPHPVGVVAYSMVADVKNVASDAAISVSPVPATDVVVVNNEGVEKVEVVATTGAVVASANGNQVNVAALANGVYVIKAYTAEGVLFAKIIKK